MSPEPEVSPDVPRAATVGDGDSLGQAGQQVGAPVPGWAGSFSPRGHVLTGRWVTLRPLVATDAQGLHTAYADQSDADWTYLSVERPTSIAATEAIVDDLLAAPMLPYAVVRQGESSPVGMLSLMRIDPANGVIEIGWVALGPGLQRTPGSTEAQRLLMGHVFEDLGYRRLEWKCDALNAPSMRAAKRLGYTYEGTFRQAIVTKGRNRDTAWWSVIDSEWPAVRDRLDAWLDPANFDATGCQHTRLGR